MAWKLGSSDTRSAQGSKERWSVRRKAVLVVCGLSVLGYITAITAAAPKATTQPDQPRNIQLPDSIYAAQKYLASQPDMTNNRLWPYEVLGRCPAVGNVGVNEPYWEDRDKSVVILATVENTGSLTINRIFAPDGFTQAYMDSVASIYRKIQCLSTQAIGPWGDPPSVPQIWITADDVRTFAWGVCEAESGAIGPCDEDKKVRDGISNLTDWTAKILR